MKIIAIGGQIGSGKTTLAEMLCDINASQTLHLETSAVVVELAEHFNALLTGFDFQAPRAQLVSNTNDALIAFMAYLQPMTFQELDLRDVQLDQAEMIAEPEWYAKLFAYYDRVAENPALINTPISSRNKDDYRPLLQWIGGFFLHRIDPLLWYKELMRRIHEFGDDITLVALTAVRTPAEADYIKSQGGVVCIIERDLPDADRSDVTERHVSEIVPDIRVINNRGLPELQALAQNLYGDILAANTISEYRGSDYR
ncbi:MAG: hypothetical protein JWN38_291 [Candidatus Saccharibacteria bacterium]|nr:hypothetical protein [Candidatus Saccharibacteria bacterium]